MEENTNEEKDLAKLLIDSSKESDEVMDKQFEEGKEIFKNHQENRIVNEILDDFEHIRLPEQPLTVCGRKIESLNLNSLVEWDGVPNGRHCPKCYELHQPNQ